MSNALSANIGTVILAAGDGKRMESAVPKVMTLLRDKPLIEYVVSAAEASRCCQKPVVVVSKKHRLVEGYLKDRARYAVQEEQLGTGHAVGTTELMLKGTADHVLVLYGDMPFLRPESISRLVEEHLNHGAVLTLMTTTVPSFAGHHASLHGFGRIIRDTVGNIIRSVELKDTTPKEAAVKEVNPCYYCFRALWLWPHLARLNNHNVQKEYYLTDLVKMAIDEQEPIASISIDPEEAIGINTKEDLAVAHDTMHPVL